MTKSCPVCELVNTTEAKRCDCGYGFVTRTGGRPPQRAWLARAIVIVIGFGLGAWHLPEGLRAFFVLGAHDGPSSWIAIICGYFVSIPAAFLTMVWPRIAGWVFVTAGVTASIATGATSADWEFLRDTCATVAGPMVVLGVVLLWATRRWTSASKTDVRRRRTSGCS